MKGASKPAHINTNHTIHSGDGCPTQQFTHLNHETAHTPRPSPNGQQNLAVHPHPELTSTVQIAPLPVPTEGRFVQTPKPLASTPPFIPGPGPPPNSKSQNPPVFPQPSAPPSQPRRSPGPRERTAMAATNIGMMDGAYFVGRNEILAWINTTLQLGLSKVEEVSAASRPVPFRSRFWVGSRSSPFSPVRIRQLFLGIDLWLGGGQAAS
jgi:hypothetical protein